MKNKHCGCNEADHMADLEVNQKERFQHQPEQMQQEDSEADPAQAGIREEKEADATMLVIRTNTTNMTAIKSQTTTSLVS